METTNANEVGVSGTTEEFPESTVEINVKTLDSQTYTLRVNKYVPVPALKEQIANLTGILSGQQRLICRGKVLKDDQLLSAYRILRFFNHIYSFANGIEAANF
ncbi:unnamed protein product [Spirodela intermedia]|uniref:Ubiquitin-like domain-containing protein n=1 Tax=Spirodela intermedia TaxID=51605 RepID=A0A7I8LI58_SPIIN|nr:unnamed protein product [Spirodela intermedia]